MTLFQQLSNRTDKFDLSRAGFTGSILAGMLPVTALSVFTAFVMPSPAWAEGRTAAAAFVETETDLPSESMFPEETELSTEPLFPEEFETEEISDWWEEEFGEPLQDQETFRADLKAEEASHDGEAFPEDAEETLILEVEELPDGTGSVKVDTALLTGRKIIFRIPGQIGKWTITAISDDGFSILRDSLKEVVLPDTIRSIGRGAFRDCSYLRKVTYGRGLEEIGDDAFAGCTSLVRAGIRKGAVRIGTRAFDGCSSLAGVNLPEGLTEIGDFAFRGCSALKRVRLPGTVEKIGTGAFAGSAVSEFRADSSNAAYESREGILFSKSDHALEAYPGGRERRLYRVPDGTASVRPYAFCGAQSLRLCMLPDSLKYIGEFAFAQSSIRVFRLSDKNAVYELIGGAIYRKRSGFTAKTLIAYPPGRTEKIHLIPKDTRRILAGAFYGNPYLEKVFFPEGLVQIQEAAFAECTGLEEVRLPSTVFDMEDEIFSGCTALKEVILPEELVWVGEQTFAGCSSLENVVFRDGLVTIGRDAFAGCVGLKRLLLPSSLELIGDRAFAGCSGLEYVRLPSSIRHLSEDAFEGCNVFTEEQWKSALEKAETNRKTMEETDPEGDNQKK